MSRNANDRQTQVEFSFTNWVLGGSLVTVKSSDRSSQRSTSKRILIREIDSDGNETTIDPRTGAKSVKVKKEDISGDGDKKKEDKGDDKEKKDDSMDKDDKEKGDKKKDDASKDKSEKKDEAPKESKDQTDKNDSNKDKGDKEKKDDFKKDDKKKDKPKKDETSDTEEEDTWTTKQDKQIKGMKTAGKTWAEIAVVVGSNKNAVRNRYKQLMAAEDSDGDKADDEDNADTDDGGNGKGDNNHGGKGSGKANDGVNGANGANGNGGGGANIKKDWTEIQDITIISMKGDNAAWNDIAMTVGASKKDVQARYKELERIARGEGDDDGGVNMPGRFEPPTPAYGMWADDIDTSEANDRWTPPTPPRKKSSSNNNGGNGGGKKDKSKNKQQDQPCLRPGCTDCFPPSQSSDYGKESEWGPTNNWGNGFTEYNQGKLRADRIWSQQDVEILEKLEREHNEHKWLRIQAAFFNWTGRMVSADLIEGKFRDDGAI